MAEFLKNSWWKLISALFLLYAVIYGFFVPVPDIGNLYNTIRNLFFHVGMWFTMLILFLTSFIYSLKYLRGFNEKQDTRTVEAVNVGLLFGILGIVTGMIWAKSTWGMYWVRDPKLDGAAVGIFIYLAYLILRGSIEDTRKRAKVSAVYNIFAFVLLIVFLLILPRIQESIHPAGKGKGNPVMPMQLDPMMRVVFYPAMIGWILLGCWIWQIRVKIRELKIKIENSEDGNK
jgi:heme exporter protein C